ISRSRCFPRRGRARPAVRFRRQITHPSGTDRSVQRRVLSVRGGTGMGTRGDRGIRVAGKQGQRRNKRRRPDGGTASPRSGEAACRDGNTEGLREHMPTAREEWKWYWKLPAVAAIANIATVI